MANYRINIGVLCTFCALAIAACDRTAIVRGSVAEVSGETLPGVAVTVIGQGVQTTTTGVGDFRLRCVPGELELAFEKTGYTPGRLALTASPGTTNATQVVLWPLPLSRGVFLFRDFRFQDTDRTEPKRFQTREFGLVYAVKKDITRKIVETAPVIICHRMPPYDLHLHELQLVEASDPELETPDYSQKVWAPVREVPFSSAPVDEPEQMLLELKPSAALAPAAYAVHWGALSGYATTDSRVFLFRVAAPDEAETPPVPEEAAAEESPAGKPPDRDQDEPPAVDEAPA